MVDVTIDSLSPHHEGQLLKNFRKEVKVISQSKEVDGHSLVGNIGGYIGLFLGK